MRPKRECPTRLQKFFQGQLKGFSGSKRYKYPKSIAKLNLSNQVKSHERSTFWKNMTWNRHFPRPAETDPHVIRRKVLFWVGLLWPVQKCIAAASEMISFKWSWSLWPHHSLIAALIESSFVQCSANCLFRFTGDKLQGGQVQGPQRAKEACVPELQNFTQTRKGLILCCI